METRKLSKRLDAVAGFVPKGARLVDVGSDHAYLPLFLVEQGWIDFAIAGEVVQGPYQSALTNVAEAGRTDHIQVRLADGLAAVVAEDKISAVTIAGMGGRLIADILAAGRDKLDGVTDLILQPNNREDELRSWLSENDFAIMDERILTESGKTYEILVVRSGQQTLSDLEVRFGPFLMREQSPVFVAKWEKELVKLQAALAKIPESNEDDRATISKKIAAIEEVLYAS